MEFVYYCYLYFYFIWHTYIHTYKCTLYTYVAACIYNLIYKVIISYIFIYICTWGPTSLPFIMNASARHLLQQRAVLSQFGFLLGKQRWKHIWQLLTCAIRSCCCCLISVFFFFFCCSYFIVFCFWLMCMLIGVVHLAVGAKVPSHMQYHKPSDFAPHSGVK